MFSAYNGHLFSFYFTLAKPLLQIANWDYVSENLVSLGKKHAMNWAREQLSCRLEGKMRYFFLYFTYFEAHENF
jgi:hypothetical protein